MGAECDNINIIRTCVHTNSYSSGRCEEIVQSTYNKHLPSRLMFQCYQLVLRGDKSKLARMARVSTGLCLAWGGGKGTHYLRGFFLSIDPRWVVYVLNTQGHSSCSEWPH